MPVGRNKIFFNIDFIKIMPLSHDQRVRYARHLCLPELGEVGQQKICDARVLVIGAGGLGSPCLLYLAAAGVGTLGIVDDDVVALSNLQRQVIHETADIGMPKVESARQALHDLNPTITLQPHAVRLTLENAEPLISGYDMVVDGCDDIATRFLVNDVCVKLKKPLISGAIHGFEGQVALFRGYLPEEPCYRCLYPEMPPADAIPTCAESGVFAPLGGVVGTWVATLALLAITGNEAEHRQQLTCMNLFKNTHKKLVLQKNSICPECGTH